MSQVKMLYSRFFFLLLLWSVAKKRNLQRKSMWFIETKTKYDFSTLQVNHFLEAPDF